jgi:hypothetical protein
MHDAIRNLLEWRQQERQRAVDVEEIHNASSTNHVNLNPQFGAKSFQDGRRGEILTY